MAKRLEKPTSFGEMAMADKTGITVKPDTDDDITRKREQARKLAQEKARARTLAKQQAMAERIASASEQLLAGVEETAAAGTEFARLMEIIAQNADRIGNNADQLRAGAVQVDRSAVELQETFQTLNERAENGIGAVRESMNGMQAMYDQLSEAAEKNQESGKRIAELEEQSRQIGEIVQAVVMIADQTNLLALNAAIEAARAGEHGRGFAVVADEVRNLAEISERSARDIRGVVEEIRSGVEQVVKDINVVVEEFVNMRGETETAYRGFEKMGELFNQYAVMVHGEVEDGAALQGKAGEVLSASEAMAAGTAQIASGSQESTKAVAEQGKALAEVNMATQELTDMAEELKTSTNINKSAEEVAATAEQLSANIEEVSTSAAEIASALAQMQGGLMNLTDDGKNVYGLFNEGGELLGQITDAAGSAGEIYDELVQILDEGRNIAAKVWKNVQDRMSSYDAINAAVESLQERIRRIEKIVDTIEIVSVQTNMLAVNGFVEAATAGEHGRGFSVVAGDIRNLANESAENADKIKDLVHDIQLQMARVVTEISLSEAASRQADEIMHGTAERNQAVTDLLQDMEQVRAALPERLQEAQAAAEQGVNDCEEVNQLLGSATTLQEAVRIGQEQAKAVNELANSIEEIASIADEMQLG
ncbi:MAG: methyl-accepting chemotaxis protein [Syntrophothermaceae bacterium]